eukprot:jgi/Orpsp1_1/1184769/evm.model.c7180000090897.2
MYMIYIIFYIWESTMPVEIIVRDKNSWNIEIYYCTDKVNHCTINHNEYFNKQKNDGAVSCLNVQAGGKCVADDGNRKQFGNFYIIFIA